jgi:hypothetical protein
MMLQKYHKWVEQVVAWATQSAGELEEEWGWQSLEEELELVLQVEE